MHTEICTCYKVFTWHILQLIVMSSSSDNVDSFLHGRTANWDLELGTVDNNTYHHLVIILRKWLVLVWLHRGYVVLPVLLGGATSPAMWCYQSCYVVLPVLLGGATSPARWCYQSCNLSNKHMLPKQYLPAIAADWASYCRGAGETWVHMQLHKKKAQSVISCTVLL